MIDLSSIPQRDPAWRRYVSSLPCCLTGSRDQVVPHHHRMKGFCGTAQKPPDIFCVPMTYLEHTRIHTQGLSEKERNVVMDQLVRLIIEYMCRRLSAEREF